MHTYTLYFNVHEIIRQMNVQIASTYKGFSNDPNRPINIYTETKVKVKFKKF